ncbi:MAG: hypothetical protein P0Y64_00640 [Candidatus Sphingomonas colombiensis]|nr:DUF6582 domain-containing protein [Sphingomonas sp.]WEK43394.1 MAG: hypothetical protein P0Y64_00640 [Sphingomonas sp.]
MSKLNQTKRDNLDAGKFAFSKQRKEPIENASHVRSAVARFNQVTNVTDAERDEAWDNIRAAAKKFNIKINENSWREIGK